MKTTPSTSPIETLRPRVYDLTTFGIKTLLGRNAISATGLEKIPKSPFILAPTHRGFHDIGVLGVLFSSEKIGRIHFMAKAEFFDNPLLARYLGWCGTFPIDRKQPTQDQLNNVFNVLGNDGITCIFPEGTIKQGPEVDEIKKSFVMLAGVANVPIVTAGVAGTDETGRSFLRRGNFHVKIGDVFEAPNLGVDLDQEPSLLRLTVKHKDYVTETAEKVRQSMQDALADANQALNLAQQA